MTNTGVEILEIVESARMQAKSAALRTLAEIISDVHGFYAPAEPDAEAALRNAFQRYQLKMREDYERMVDLEISTRLDSFLTLLKRAMSAGLGRHDRGSDFLVELFAQYAESARVNYESVDVWDSVKRYLENKESEDKEVK
jgi:hypothetical protein